MLEFWKEREPREKWLLAIATILLFVLIFYQFIWVTVLTFNTQEARRYKSAVSELEFVRNSIGKSVLSKSTASTNTPLQAVVVDSAGVFGLSISRIEPSSNEGLNLWFNEEAPTSLYAWLVDLEENHNVYVGKASIREIADTAKVSANIYLSRRS